ncbi:MAG: hypothetical protein AB1705_06725 [Verrucomicrobiota bacterium]
MIKIAMGHWGEKLLENDYARGVVRIWDTEVKREIRGIPKANQGAWVIQFYRENYFDGEMRIGSTGENAELLALGELMRSRDIVIPPEFKGTLNRVVSLELTEPFLGEWANRDARKKALLDFLEAIGGQLVADVDLDVSSGPLEFANVDELEQKITEWMESDDQLDRECPGFLKLLDRMCRAQLGWDYDDLYHEGSRQRLMLIVFFAGRWLRLPKEEIMRLVKKASKSARL